MGGLRFWGGDGSGVRVGQGHWDTAPGHRDTAFTRSHILYVPPGPTWLPQRKVKFLPLLYALEQWLETAVLGHAQLSGVCLLVHAT